MDFKRESGIIMHISSLPGKYGIGDFGYEAYRFVDFLYKSGVKNWQMLPLNPTSYGDSPYQSFSSFAYNPYFISFDQLLADDLLSVEDVFEDVYKDSVVKVNYGLLYEYKYRTLWIAYKNNCSKKVYDLEEFLNKQRNWVEDYCLFMALKNYFGGMSWQNWPQDIKRRDVNALAYYRELLAEQIEYQLFMQCVCEKHYTKLKNYAGEKGIKIIGDVPIYVALDSCDVWVRPDLFMLNDDLEVMSVGGCPPDAFSADGQLWGNPLYNWQKHEQDNYDWWISRLQAAYNLFDIVRLDHFRGFESFWSIPAKDLTARGGVWVLGPGIKFFDAIKKRLPEAKIIVEDLGDITDNVRELRTRTGYPGMRVLQFAFNPYDESENLPHRVNQNSIYYTGTHDNLPLSAWLDNGNLSEIEFAKKYLNLNQEEGFVWGMIRGVWSSVACLAIAQMQDFLELGIDTRMNLPNTLGNWEWRMLPDVLNDELANKIKILNKIYYR